MKRNGRLIGDGSLNLRKTVNERTKLYLAKMKNILLVNTQSIRARLINQLQGVFDLAVSIAKGKVKRLRNENGKEYKVTLKQREKWARIAAYAAQVMAGLTTGFDEKQFQTDLKKLEDMVEEVSRPKEAGKKDPAVV